MTNPLPDNRLLEPLDAVIERAALGNWRPLVDAWRRSTAGRALVGAVDGRRASGATIYPARVLRTFETTPPESARVVILGQDPYHGPGQAEGLAFSVPAGVRPPPSLVNIFLELERDLGHPRPTSGSLLSWATGGVMLLNASLTVEDGQPGSHGRLGWRSLTDAVIDALAGDPAPKVFLLWGSPAQAQAARIAAAGRGHLVLAANHPSPLSARRPPVPFLGCGHFSAANAFLRVAGRPPIDWRLPAPA